MRLGVNIDHVATVRQARGARQPDPLDAARSAEAAGADQITVHLREDRRHIQDHDVERLRESVRTHLNLEMAATEEMIGIALRLRPETCTLVPEKREELTTEGGLDAIGKEAAVAEAVARLGGAGMRVSLFIDPDLHQIEAAARIGAGAVELATGAYSEAGPQERSVELGRLDRAAKSASQRGLEVLAGHGLDYDNVSAVVGIPEIAELNIGHAIVARALSVGMKQAVQEMLVLLR